VEIGGDAAQQCDPGSALHERVSCLEGWVGKLTASLAHAILCCRLGGENSWKTAIQT
jgi:hypothetical protein